MEVGAALRLTLFDLLRVSLDEPTSSLLDGGENGAEAGPGHPTATVAAAGEDTADPTPSGWKPMHQQPPHTPLLASTSRAKSSQVSGESSRVT
jgi:hypothetical protein